MAKDTQGRYEVGGIRPGISRREGHMEPADRRKAADDADYKAAQKRRDR